MENLDVSQKELESIKSKFKYWGYESSIYEASEKSLYKIFINMPRKKLRNKKKKIELLYDMQIPIFRNPIRTLSEEGRFIGYEIEWNKNDVLWSNSSIVEENKIEMLKKLKDSLLFLEQEGIIYGDLKADNLLINSVTNELNFCDLDNTQIEKYKMDTLLNVIYMYHSNRRLYQNDVHAYMHNLFTLNELIYHTSKYDDLMYEIENYTEEFTTLFNESGKEVIKCIAKQKRKKKVEPLYLIDNLKKVS